MGGRRWTDEEKAELASIAREGLHLVSHMDRLPGRTYEAAKIYASKLGIALSDASAWADDERETLRRIYRGNESIKSAVRRLLPHRSYIAAKGEAQRLGLSGTKKQTGRTGLSWVERAIEMMLERHDLLTIRELAEKTGASTHGIGRILVRQRGKKFHVGGWIRERGTGDWAGRWSLGGGIDAARPARQTATEACRKWRMKQRIRAGHVDPFANLIRQVTA
ncbi:hypothetical protein [Burkholderia singularis]|uniref:Uncharacterized protein n=1 Tax=Burkholderia singularis TaxID=1503053 RepID=A0A238H520_9BURK|nr:hypothetical protein [Burkholderia singularis]SMG00348.1 hypothetical protein BSIN_3418 [Burkholderia singularis]